MTFVSPRHCEVRSNLRSLQHHKGGANPPAGGKEAYRVMLQLRGHAA
jgi:hypothetical protein